MTTCRPAGDLSGQINAIGFGAWAAGGTEWRPGLERNWDLLGPWALRRLVTRRKPPD
jgi:hypothetical protein